MELQQNRKPQTPPYVIRETDSNGCGIIVVERDGMRHRFSTVPPGAYYCSAPAPCPIHRLGVPDGTYFWGAALQLRAAWWRPEIVAAAAEACRAAGLESLA